MLDIVQSFPLLSYCIVSPIYISPICNVEIHYSEKIKLGILYFSLFTGSMKIQGNCSSILSFLFSTWYSSRAKIEKIFKHGLEFILEGVGVIFETPHSYLRRKVHRGANVSWVLEAQAFLSETHHMSNIYFMMVFSIFT